jgi:SAM-dependent methyltransferase
MEKSTDWIALWRALALARSKPGKDNTGPGNSSDIWRDRARSFDARVKRRWARSSDAVRDLITSIVSQDATVLDIGAGTGSWAMLLARHAQSVTAVELSPAMIDVLRENLASEAIGNVHVIQGMWPDVEVSPHDYSLCAHGMYGFADFPRFIERMMAVTRRTCFLTMRMPTADGVMAEAAKWIWGQRHDSPNGVIAYNALLQMGLFPNVLMEDGGQWKAWTSDSLEDALAKIKGRFSLDDVSPHDDFLTDLLRQRLTYVDGRYVWPDGVRTALIYWKVD